MADGSPLGSQKAQWVLGCPEKARNLVLLPPGDAGGRDDVPVAFQGLAPVRKLGDRALHISVQSGEGIAVAGPRQALRYALAKLRSVVAGGTEAAGRQDVDGAAGDMGQRNPFIIAVGEQPNLAAE